MVVVTVWSFPLGIGATSPDTYPLDLAPLNDVSIRGSSSDQINIEPPNASYQSDSDTSVQEDMRCSGHETPRHHRGGRRNHTWNPEKYRLFGVQQPSRSTVLETILRREHYSGDYIGDDDALSPIDDSTIRICTSNINKGLYRKMTEELASWIIAHQLDFVIVSDPGFSSRRVDQVWVTDADTTRRVPGLMLVGARKVAIVMDKERWENRVNLRDISYSPSQRSIRLVIRLYKSRLLWLIGTYCPHSPDRAQSLTEAEWQWIQTQITEGRSRHAIVVTAGDFNTYVNDELDRVADNERNDSAKRMGQNFGDWTDTCGIVSCFRTRHPTAQRYTYSRGGIKTTLDDIYVSVEHSSAIASSGIWINSIASSDHTGTPFVTIVTSRGENISRNLSNINPIKVVNTRTKTPEDMAAFTMHTAQLLHTGHISLVDDIDDSTCTTEELESWIEAAIANLNLVLYSSAKLLWGETSQSKRQLARSVCVSRSRRCSAQIRTLKTLTKMDGVQVSELWLAISNLMWPKWVWKPQLLLATCAHRATTLRLLSHLNATPIPTEHQSLVRWTQQLCSLWTKTIKVRRNWRRTSCIRTAQERRSTWFSTGEIRRFLDSSLGRRSAPVSIRSTITIEDGSPQYSEDRQVVQQELTSLLDNWIPADERPERPRFLDTRSDEDAENLPEFVKQWILPDIRNGGRYSEWWTGEHAWEQYEYNSEMQEVIDRKLKKHVAPGYGGVSQEMWISAPSIVRQRERRVIQLILQSGYAPKILKKKQMVFLPKHPNIDPTLDNSLGLPPWRPITIQAALANRLFLIIKIFVDQGIPISVMQHGFQCERTVQDAVLLTTLLFDRARSKLESLFVVSKDCLKCFDRILAWVMELLYLGAGVPETPLRLMIDLLGPGEIDVRTAFGWISTGAREFGIGQGSILAILHIACYMDVLQEQLEKCPDPVSVHHNQEGSGIDIGSTLFVDDQLDVATSIAGIQARADVTNLFTGKNGSGGVFGAAKSFMLYIDDGKHHDAVALNDGNGIPQPVQVVSPQTGFKHLGIQQGGSDLWASSLAGPWKSITADAQRILHLNLKLPQFRYVVNRIWIPRLKYRMALSGAVKLAEDMDTYIRQVARSVLRLPLSLPRATYYDRENGLGLHSCVDVVTIERVQITLRVANSPHIPAYHLLMEQLEDYQLCAGLATNPLVHPVSPPPRVHSWLSEVIRSMAALETPITITCDWVCPPMCKSQRSNDRPLSEHTDTDLMPMLVALNWYSGIKLRYVGDISNEFGTKLLSRSALIRKGRWTTAQKTKVNMLIDHWTARLTTGSSVELLEPVGCTPVDPSTIPYQVRVGVGEWILVSQIDVNSPDPRVTDEHEIGYRDIDDTRRDAFGLMIHIRWWYQRRSNSDIWYARTHLRSSWEYEASCVLITPTYLPRTQRRQQRVIVWNDTCVEGLSGANSRELLEEAARRITLRFESTLSTGTPVELHTCCSHCGRFRRVKYCVRCGRWHHRQCVLANSCFVDPRDNTAYAFQCTSSAQYRWNHTTDQDCLQAGDGSVTNASTLNASGTWAVQVPGGIMATGVLKMHHHDLTSTRCELHALLAGLVLGGDCGTQICDNKSAIALFSKCREYSTARQGIISFRDPHRIELRSILKALSPNGTMSPKWVKSHQENIDTTDVNLSQERQALASVDAAACEAHHQRSTASYASWLVTDKFMLLDTNGLLVFGNTGRYLDEHVYKSRRLVWLSTQDDKPESRHTLLEDDSSMISSSGWDSSLQRFYWRARSGTLHTNVVKNRMDERWPQECRFCRTEPDTQSHRFGLSEPLCDSITHLLEERAQLFWNMDKTLLLPDQLFLLPALGHQLAASFGKPQRCQWNDTGAKAAIWKPMVEVRPGLWLHAHWVYGLLEDAPICQFPRLIDMLARDLYRPFLPPAGRLLPHYLVATLRAIHPSIGLYKASIYYWSPGWTAATFDPPLPSELLPALQHLLLPSTIDIWWVDDVFRPRTEGWWDDFCHDFRNMATSEIPHTFWMCCYEGLPGASACVSLGVKWVLRIPPGELFMRTDYSIRQSPLPQRFKSIFGWNTCAILIGVVSTTHSTEHTVRRSIPLWEQILTQRYSVSWIIETDVSDQLPLLPHPCFDLTIDGDQGYDMLPLWWVNLRSQASGLDLSVYTAPKGWRHYPTMSKRSWTWAQALSCTSRGAKTLHLQFFNRVWNVLRTHWNYTCRETVHDIQFPLTLWRDVNTGIRRRRESHANVTRDRISRLITAREDHLSAHSVQWHNARSDQLYTPSNPAGSHSAS